MQNNPRDERHPARWRAEVERRLRQLETSPRAGHTSISNGRLLVRDGETGALIASFAGAAGTDLDGNPYPAGLSAEAGSLNGQIIQPETITADAIAAGAIVAGHIAAGAIDGQVITGATIQTVSNDGGFFAYAGTPTLGNLIVSIASADGTDDFGNAYPQGLDVNQGAISGSLITVEPGPGNGIFVYSTMPTVTTFTSGSGTWVCPAGVTSVKVECWGGGGAGSDHTSADGDGGGGGGGEYAAEPAYAVTPGNGYTYAVGAGGTTVSNGDGNDGDSTIFDSTNVLAYGGLGGGLGGFPGAPGTGSGNTVHNNGGLGGFSEPFTGQGAGGGGGSGGYTSAGNAGGQGISASKGGAGAAAVTGGGAGGDGGTSTKAAAAGGTPGGGGGGAGSQGTPGKGTNGRISITYTPARTLLASIAGQAGTDPYGNTYPAGISGGTPTSWTPAVTGGGAATWSTADGWYFRFGALIFFNAYLVVGTAGSGTSNLAITLPVTPYRGAANRRQAYTGAIGGTAGTAVDGPLACWTFAGSATGVDRLVMANGGNLQGQHLGAGAIITIQGVIREA